MCYLPPYYINHEDRQHIAGYRMVHDVAGSWHCEAVNNAGTQSCAILVLLLNDLYVVCLCQLADLTQVLTLIAIRMSL